MLLTKILKEHSNSFKGKFKCEFCGHIEEEEVMYNYNEEYYHVNILPNKKCPKCSRSTMSELFRSKC